MPEAGDISEDRGFKALFTSYPQETIEVFVPELLAERGKPVTVEAIQQESARPDLGDPNRFLDVALLATWADGRQAVILLVEHWSDIRKVDLRRVLWYLADLSLRHPQAAVFPVILVTDSSAGAIPDRLEMTIAGVTTLMLQARAVRVTAADLPRLRALQNRVAAILTTLAARDAVDAVIATLEHMARSPGPIDDLERFLPFAMKLARMRDADAPRFRRRLEETGMVNVITEMKNEALAKALAKAGQATVATIRRMLSRGIISADAARAEIRDLMETGAIPRDIGEEALITLK